VHFSKIVLLIHLFLSESNSITDQTDTFGHGFFLIYGGSPGVSISTQEIDARCMFLEGHTSLIQGQLLLISELQSCLFGYMLFDKKNHARTFQSESRGSFGYMILEIIDADLTRTLSFVCHPFL
jgi:hypothetical protein